jgi:GTP:adenosylcobinamide-phosphate guanylyltransferase
MSTFIENAPKELAKVKADAAAKMKKTKTEGVPRISLKKAGRSPKNKKGVVVGRNYAQLMGSSRDDSSFG